MSDASQDNDENNMNNMKMKTTTSTSETLFHRLGGVSVVRTAVEEFYTRLLNDAELSPFFDNTKMVILKQHQLEFFKLALTEIPPDLDVGAMLLEKHDALFSTPPYLNEYHFDLVANHFVATLSHLGVCADMIDEAAGVILPLRIVFEQGALKYADQIAAFAEKEKKMTNNETTTTTLLVSVESSSSSSATKTAELESAPAPATTVLHAAAQQQEQKETNLHDTLGGVAGLKMVVETFYQRLLQDAELSLFFEDVNMTALKLHQVQFMKIAFSQIPENIDVSDLMRQKHAALFEKGLNEKHFDLVLQHFIATLQTVANIEESVVTEAVAVLVPLRVVFEQGAAAAATTAVVTTTTMEQQQQPAAASSSSSLAALA